MIWRADFYLPIRIDLLRFLLSFRLLKRMT